jgi:hypothetical protein
VIKGKMNKDAAEKRAGADKGRLPVTLNIMMLLKKLIRQWDKPVMERLLVWTVCTLAFARSFRISELLCNSERTFDPDHTLLAEDVWERENRQGRVVLNVKLKCPKETKSAEPTVVDIFETEGPACPIRAWKKWKCRADVAIGTSLFKNESGIPLTGKKLNGYLKGLLEPYMDYSKGKITTHSFWAGIPTMLAAAGHDTDDIKKSWTLVE